MYLPYLLYFTLRMPLSLVATSSSHALDCIIISFMKEYQSLVSELCPRARFYDMDGPLSAAYHIGTYLKRSGLSHSWTSLYLQIGVCGSAMTMCSGVIRSTVAGHSGQIPRTRRHRRRPTADVRAQAAMPICPTLKYSTGTIHLQYKIKFLIQRFTTTSSSVQLCCEITNNILVVPMLI